MVFIIEISKFCLLSKSASYSTVLAVKVYHLAAYYTNKRDYTKFLYLIIEIKFKLWC